MPTPQNDLNSIPEALESFRQGRLVIVVDDEDRENEGDFIGAAELCNAEMVNFMTKVGRGLICVALTQEQADRLDLPLMVQPKDNTALYGTPFTVSVDYIEGTTTGVSAEDRAKTIRALSHPRSRSTDFRRPGHIFPLRSSPGGVLMRAGHTEAAVDLARLSGLNPAGVLVEIMKDDGTMARLEDLKKIAKTYNLPLITIKDLISYRTQNESLVEKLISVNLPTKFGNFQLLAFKNILTNEEHLALVKGKWDPDEAVLVRVHSQCLTGEIFHSLRCDCRQQLEMAMEAIEKEGKGAIVYLKQEGRGIGLLNKLKAYRLQDSGLDTVEANLALAFAADNRDYGIGCQILRSLGIRRLRLLTNNPIKRIGLEGYGLEIVERIPLHVKANEYNRNYLRTKVDKLGHLIPKELIDSAEEK